MAASTSTHAPGEVRVRPRRVTVAGTLRTLATATLLGTPVVLAYFSGGYFDEAREVALIVVWATVAVAALTVARPLRGRPALIAVGGLAGFTAWVWLSARWAPQADRADAELQRALCYLGALVAAGALLQGRRDARALEPALVAGAVIVIGYGLIGRLLPGLVHLHRDLSAGGRLDQPLTYWNATGALAALATVLAVRLAGDRGRAPLTRASGAAAAVPLLQGAYLSFSRGALGALLVGLVTLLALSPGWTQLRSLALALAPAAAATALVASLAGVASLSGTLATREREGALALALTLAAIAGAAALALVEARGERDGRLRRGPLPLPPAALRLAPLVIVALAAIPVVAAGSQSGPAAAPAFGATVTRLETTGSNRYAYWRVALRSFADHPLIGLGAGGFADAWLRRRTLDETVQDAHSLQLQTAAEEGLVGLLALALAFAGVALAARRVQRRDPALAAGPIAALVVWVVHSAIDWDWQMPALTLLAVLLAGMLLARSEDERIGGVDLA